jgi:hypothetical protein
MSMFAVAATAVENLAIKSHDPVIFQVECRYCGWGDHNTAWHEQQEKEADDP